MIFIRETDLQTMCLNVIVQHMQYITKPNKSTELYVEFLRRCYSDRLYSLLEKKFIDPEQYVEWLLTPYWKNVSLPTSIDYPMNNIIGKLQVMGHTIVSLNLENSPCSADMLSAIVCCVPNVTCLNLKWTYCTDNLLSLIRKMCIALNTLNLEDCRNVTDAGMMNLCNVNKKDSGFDTLKVLNILKTPVTHKGVAILLKNMPSLQWLSYKGLSMGLYYLHKSNVHNTSVRYNLRLFEYSQTSVKLKQVLKVWTVMCPFVTNVCIRDNMDETDFQLCAKFQCLKKLKIININYFPREIVISPFITLKGSMLTELEVMHATVSVEQVVKLCYNLKRIFFFNVTFEDFSSSDINEFNSLTSLTVKHLNFQRDFAFKSIILLLKASKNLNELYIHFVEHFSDTLADTILELPKLTLVDFYFVDISVQTFLRFLKCESINKIRMDGCPAVFYEDSEISKLVSNNNEFGNTCSWMVDYSEVGSESVWDYSVWTGEITS